MMLPIVLPVLRLFQQENDQAFAPSLILAVAYGANIGGMSTLVGTAPNAILAGFLEILRREQEALGPMSQKEKTVAVVFILTASLWITRNFLEPWLPWMNDTSIAMSGGISLFLLPALRGSPEKILVWSQAQIVPWEVLILIGGGLSLAAAIQKNGVAEWIGSFASLIGWLPATGLVFLVVWLTEITSNAAITSTFLPIAAAMAAALGQTPVLLSAAVALSSSCAFMLPVATPPNAIVFGSGFVSLPPNDAPRRVAKHFLLNHSLHKACLGRPIFALLERLTLPRVAADLKKNRVANPRGCLYVRRPCKRKGGAPCHLDDFQNRFALCPSP